MELADISSALTGENVVVTCLYDLTSGRTDRRSLEEYLALAEPLLTRAVPMVIFTEPFILPALQRVRPKALKTRYVVRLYEDLIQPLGIYPVFETKFQDRLNINRSKDTPAYMSLMHAKFLMLEEAAQHDDQANVIWVDIGIAHVAKQGVALIDNIASNTTFTDRALFAHAFPELPPPPEEILLRRFFGRVCGGLFSIPKKHARAWREVMDSALRKALEADLYPFECDLLYALLVRSGRLHGGPVTVQLPSFATYAIGGDYREAFSKHPAITTSPRQGA